MIPPFSNETAGVSVRTVARSSSSPPSVHFSAAVFISCHPAARYQHEPDSDGDRPASRGSTRCVAGGMGDAGTHAAARNGGIEVIHNADTRNEVYFSAPRAARRRLWGLGWQRCSHRS